MENHVIEAVKPFAGIVNNGDFPRLGIRLRSGKWVQYISGTAKFADALGQESVANPGDIEMVEWLQTGETFQAFTSRKAEEAAAATKLPDDKTPTETATEVNDSLPSDPERPETETPIGGVPAAS